MSNLFVIFLYSEVQGKFLSMLLRGIFHFTLTEKNRGGDMDNMEYNQDKIIIKIYSY